MVDFFLIVNYYLDVFEIKQVPQWERFSDEPITYEPSDEWVEENQKLFSLFWFGIQKAFGKIYFDWIRTKNTNIKSNKNI